MAVVSVDWGVALFVWGLAIGEEAVMARRERKKRTWLGRGDILSYCMRGVTGCDKDCVLLGCNGIFSEDSTAVLIELRKRFSGSLTRSLYIGR
jgi:hypothetical protein